MIHATTRPTRVLFVCTGNSCRSIMAEALLRSIGGAEFEVHSAGTHPNGLNDRALRTLADAGLDASWARSKSVDEFAGQAFDDVITLCDDARQACPVFPGARTTRHWGFADPALATGPEEQRMAVYRAVFEGLEARIRAYVPDVAAEHAAAAGSTSTP